MKQILFVDDQTAILDGQRASMAKFSGQASFLFAGGGKAAREVIRSTPVDVIVSASQMSEMSGQALFETVREEYPDIVRIMLCPLSNVEGVFEALKVSHQVLHKPIDADSLFNGIERTCRLRELMTGSLRKAIGDIRQLPPVPAVYNELMAAMARPDVATRNLARIIEKDAAMAAKTLQLVNSTCFSISRSITRLDHAVSYLGMELVRNLCLTVHVFSAFNQVATRMGLSLDEEQQHSILTARITRRLMPNQKQAENAFTAALLHDVGNLVFAVCLPAEFKKSIRLCETSGRPAHEVETEVIGASHAEAGAYLLSLWGLPFPIVEAVGFHHVPGGTIEKTFDIPSAVCVANALVEHIQKGQPLVIEEHLKSLKMRDKLPDWLAIAEEELQGTPVVEPVARS